MPDTSAKEDPAIRKEWSVGTAGDERGYVLAPGPAGTMEIQAEAKTPEIATTIVRDHNVSRIVKDHYLGRECWMTTAPKCPEHGKILDLEWKKDHRIMWYCSTCLGAAGWTH